MERTRGTAWQFQDSPDIWLCHWIEGSPLRLAKVALTRTHSKRWRAGWRSWQIPSKRCHCAWLSVGVALVASLWLSLSPAIACGPFFPNNLLDRGDAAILTAPEVRFVEELKRMKLVTSSFRALPSTNAPHATLEAELNDLRAALDGANLPPQDRDLIIGRHREERLKIEPFALADERATNAAVVLQGEFPSLRPDPTNLTRIHGPVPQATPGLPSEFADYLRGSVAWHQGNLKAARQAWSALLNRPPKERRYKSVWAAFMLGKSWEEENRRLACEYFQKTRYLATNGFADTLGLAASSLGWEARCNLLEGKLDKAIDLYLEQADSGEPSAVVSLRLTARSALNEDYHQLPSLAAKPHAQRVITAYVISGGFRNHPIDVDGPVKDRFINLVDKAATKTTMVPTPKANWHHFERPALLWLAALEKAQVKDAEAAEQIALAAYQAGEMDTAQRWLERCRSTPVVQWLQAKLHLRNGKINEAIVLLAHLCRSFPVVARETNLTGPRQLLDSLYINKGEYYNISVPEELRGELAVFRLARRQYVESLDLLMRSSFWADAAYVAERVLTVEELKAYVDLKWPSAAVEVVATNEPFTTQWDGPEQPANRLSPSAKIRYLLARRLARADRFAEARGYFPAEWVSFFDDLVAALHVTTQQSATAEQRAQAYYAAALLTRKRGLELVGTELEPDWRLYDGNYQGTLTVTERESQQNSNVLFATVDELNRSKQHSPEPNQRFHYRYIAASLAWKAAELMPNNTDETARVLWQAGTWLKNRDPEAADVFYKALVRRCRKTALGAEADRLRWFPKLDQQ
jgi:hypothetical protein